MNKIINYIFKLHKKLYTWLGFKFEKGNILGFGYPIAELIFPNRLIYAVMLLGKCYTMKQFREKNERLLRIIIDNKCTIKSIEDLRSYLISSRRQKHIDDTREFFKNELGINVD